MIRLITGPPGAGKNTYVEENKKDGDVVLDFDILRELAGGSIERAKVMREAFENDLQNYDTDVWVIRCVADAKARTELAERLKAEQVVVVETPADVAKERVVSRGREPERNDEVFSAIDNWWSQYGVVESDLIVRPSGHNLSDRKKTMDPDLELVSGPEETDKGFPANTKIVDMTAEQQAAYWKHKSRKHEGNATSLKAQLDAKVAAEKPAAAPAADKPEAGAPLDADTLRKQIMEELKKEQAPGLVRSQFEALIGDRLPEATRDSILEDLDLAKFVKEDGSIDKDRIKSKAELLAPAEVQGSNGGRKPRTHQGERRNEPKSSVSAGKALFEEFSKTR
jgi:dephospho-CoA kinase